MQARGCSRALPRSPGGARRRCRLARGPFAPSRLRGTKRLRGFSAPRQPVCAPTRDAAPAAAAFMSSGVREHKVECPRQAPGSGIGWRAAGRVASLCTCYHHPGWEGRTSKRGSIMSLSIRRIPFLSELSSFLPLRAKCKLINDSILYRLIHPVFLVTAGVSGSLCILDVS